MVLYKKERRAREKGKMKERISRVNQKAVKLSLAKNRGVPEKLRVLEIIQHFS